MSGDAVGFESAEAILQVAEFVEARELWYSSNFVFLSQLRTEQGEQFAAIYKPERGESPLWDFPDGTLYRREVAAYRLARLLEWDFVPPTVVRDGPHGPGAVQVFIKHDPQVHFFVQREQPDLVPQLQRMAAFDFIANNADRKGGHCLLDEEGRIWGIDHGLCFHQDYKLRTVIWDWADEPVPEHLLADVDRALGCIEAGAPEATALTELLSGRETAALVQRMEMLLERRRLPKPGPHRSHPWPLV